MAVDIEAQVQNKITQVNEIITVALASAEVAVENLQEIANLRPPYVTGTIDPYTPEPITIDAIKPDAPDLEQQLAALVASNIEDVQIKDIELKVEPIPDDILAWIPKPIEYTDPVYESQLLEALKQKLFDDLATGGTGLTPSIEQDMIDLNSERDAQIWRDARDKVLATWATTGFIMPDNVLNAAIRELISKEANALLDRSRDIRIESFKLATENKRFTIQQGIVLESALMQHFNATAERALRFVIASAETSATIYRSLIEAYKVQNEIALQDVQIQTEIEKLKIAQLQAKLDKYKTDADVAILKIKALIDKYQVDISAYSAELSKAEVMGRLNVSQQQMVATHYLSAFQSGLQAAKGNVDAFIGLTNVQTGASTSIGNIYANYVASALNSLSAVLNMSANQEQQIAAP